MAEGGQFNTTATAATVDILGYSCRCSALCSHPSITLVICFLLNHKAVIGFMGVRVFKKPLCDRGHVCLCLYNL